MTETPKAIKRPGQVTFAAIMMFLLGGFSVVWAVEEFAKGAWLKEFNFGLIGKNLMVWGVTDIIVAIVAVFAGQSILKGGSAGRWIAIVIAVLSAMRAFYYLPWIPIGALIIIAIDVFIIYGLSTHDEYFEKT